MGVSRTVLLAAAVVASLMEGVQPWSVPVARPTVAPRGLRARACSLRAPQSPPSAARRSCVGLRMAGARALLRRVLLLSPCAGLVLPARTRFPALTQTSPAPRRHGAVAGRGGRAPGRTSRTAGMPGASKRAIESL